MVTIQTVDARGMFTKKLVEVYQQRPKPTSFLRSFFPAAPPTDTLELSIEVQRNGEKIAVDVLRGTDGNRNEFSRSTEKIFIPPYYREYWDRNHMSVYEQQFRNTEISSAAFFRLLNSSVDHTMMCQEKIERAYEVLCAQTLEDGILTLKSGDTIDFKRKAGSKVNLTANPWTTGATNVFAQLETGCTWLRQNAKITNFRFNCILGSEAASALFLNTTFLNRQNLFHMNIDTVAIPQKNAVGGVYLGTLTAGPYQVDLWSYPAEYEDPANGNALTAYWDTKKICLLPQNPNFTFGYACTPQLLEPGEQPEVGQFIVSEYTDPLKRVRQYHVESAGMPIPVAVDMAYTAQVVG